MHIADQFEMMKAFFMLAAVTFGKSANVGLERDAGKLQSRESVGGLAFAEWSERKCAALRVR